MFPTTILVGVDATSAGRAALLAGAELARLTGSPLHLVHVKVDSPLLHGRPATPRQRERADAEANELLEREAAVAREHGVEPMGTHLRFGSAIDRVFAQVQDELSVGLLVVGARRSGRVARWLDPGVGTVRRSRTAVLVVRDHQAAARA